MRRVYNFLGDICLEFLLEIVKTVGTNFKLKFFFIEPRFGIIDKLGESEDKAF